MLNYSPVLSFKSAGHRTKLVLAALTAFIALYAAVAVPKASATVQFCDHVTLQPYGKSGDRCWGPGNLLLNASVSTFERAGCVDFANNENVLLQSWVCGPSGSQPAAYIYAVNDGVRRKGVIRNNNLSSSGVFIGDEVCYSGC